MNKEEVLLELAHRLEEKYGVRPGIFHREGYIRIEDVSRPDGPIIPDDIELIIKEVAQKFNLKFTDLAFSIQFGNIQVGFADQ